MKLYLALLRISIQDSIQNRVESAIWFLYEILPPLMMAAVWLAAYEGQESVAGYSLPEMLAYTVGVMTLRTVVTVYTEYGIDEQIRQGTLSTHLVRPMNMWAYWFVDSLGWKTFRNMLSVPVLVGALLWLGPEIGRLSVPIERLPALVVSLLLSTGICFFLKLCLGFVGFWTNDIYGISTVYEVIANVLGGVMMPLALLPAWLQLVAQWLPIQAIYAVPLNVLLGKVSDADVWWGIGLQLCWIVALWGLALVLWRAGLRRYESVGG
jgi:ABC-2 type transport system permease protein